MTTPRKKAGERADEQPRVFRRYRIKEFGEATRTVAWQEKHPGEHRWTDHERVLSASDLTDLYSRVPPLPRKAKPFMDVTRGHGLSRAGRRKTTA